MRNLKFKLFTILSAGLILSSCTEPGETTAIGAATGGVIGAGLGAIVGNQAGSPGSGLAIGTVAGAGAGAAIGNALEAQQKAVRTQDEALERQQKMLAAQNAEIRELRNMPSDADSAIGSAMRSEAKINRNNRPASVAKLNADSSMSFTDQLNTGADRNFADSSLANRRSTSSSEARAAIKPQVVKSQTTGTQPHTVAPAKDKIASALNEIEPDATDTNQVSAALATSTAASAAVTASNSLPSGVKGLSEKDLAPASESAKIVSDSVVGGECGKGESEAQRAESSMEPADKLFYLRRAIRLCPSNASYHTRLANEYALLGRNEDAKASFEDALKLDSSLSEAKTGLANLASQTLSASKY